MMFSGHSSRVNMPQLGCARRILLALTLCYSCALNGYGWSSSWLLHPSTSQQETIMSFVLWIVLGLAAGLIGSRLVKRGGEGILPDILLGVAGAMAGGWLSYAFGLAGVNGFNLFSLFAAVIGSLAFLLTYYALRQL